MSEKILKATHEGFLKVGDIEISCAVLEDNTRVLNQRGFLRSLGRGKRGKITSLEATDNLPPFLNAKNLQPFVSEDLRRTTTPILFKSLKGGGREGNISYGYDAKLLPAVCDVFLRARDAGALLEGQRHIAERCEILVRGFATVGIIALIDEATGKQYDRDQDELQRILALYISPELLPWTKRFPDEFYKQLFRLMKWQYAPLSVKRPSYVGKLTNEYIYKPLPPKVLETLRDKNPPIKPGYRRYKHFQFLTENIGNPHLEKQLAIVTALMRISNTWGEFKRHFARAFGAGQEELDLKYHDEE